MSDAAYWTKENKDGDPVRVTAPKSVVEMAQCLPAAWPFPVLRGVIGTPTLRQDGSLLTVAGYDDMTGYVLYDPPALPPIPNRPTKIDAQTALGVLRELLAEFPFADQAR